MHKNSFRLFYSTLLLSLLIFVGGCASAVQTTTDEELAIQAVPIESASPIVTPPVETDSSRFVCESIEIPSPADSYTGELYYPFFDYSFIITDSETGKQYLYLYHDNGRDGGPVMVELDSTVNDNNHIDK